MKIINSSVLNLLILTNMLLLKTPVRCIPGNVLNIADDAREVCNVVRRDKLKGLLLTTYIAYNRHNIVRIMDAGSLLWDAGITGRRLFMLVVYTLNNINRIAYVHFHHEESFTTYYFKKIGFEWISITMRNFANEMLKIEKERSVDINDKPDPSIFMTSKHQIFGVPAKVILPSDKIDLVTVTDDCEIVWTKRRDTQKATCVIAHGNKGNISLVHLHLNDNQVHDEIFYAKLDGEWEIVSKTQFYIILGQLDDEEEKRKKKDSGD